MLCSIILICTDAVCWFSSDHLTVLLGNVKIIKENNLSIQFSSNNNIRSFHSLPYLSSAMLNIEIIVPMIPSEVIYIFIYIFLILKKLSRLLKCLVYNIYMYRSRLN